MRYLRKSERLLVALFVGALIYVSTYRPAFSTNGFRNPLRLQRIVARGVICRKLAHRRYTSGAKLPCRAGPEGVLLVTGSDQPSWGRTQIVFDIMDTVVYDPFRNVASKFFDMSESDFFKVKNSSAWFAFERGDIDEAQLRATYFKDGRDFDFDGFKMALVEGYAFIDGMPDLLQDLAAVGHKLHGFTNYPEWYTLIEEKLRLEAEFGLQWSCVSCDTGLRKPEPAAYLNLLRRLGVGRKVGAAPVLFIDDSVENCDAAQHAGIFTVQFKNAVDLRRSLGDILGSRKRGTAPANGWPKRVMR